MLYYIMLGFFIGGIVTLLMLKGLVFYCRTALDGANQTYSVVIRNLDAAIKEKKEAIEIRDEALESARLVRKDMKDFKMRIGN